MTALDFPSSPTYGQSYGNYTWDGEKWCFTLGGVPALPTYTTWNPSDLSGATLSGGNLVLTGTGGGSRSIAACTGKKYWEQTYTAISTNSITQGVALASADLGFGATAGLAYVGRASGQIVIHGAAAGTPLGIIAQSSAIGVAVDTPNQLIWFRKAPSGDWNANSSANPATGTGGLSLAAMSSGPLYAMGHGVSGDVLTSNFGATTFVGAVPSGFTAGLTA